MIFDFHGVLADLGDVDRWLQGLAGNPDFTSAIEELETGHIGIAQFLCSLPTDVPASRGLKLNVRPQLLHSVRSLRCRGFRVALLTNAFRGFAGIRTEAGVPDDLFDAVMESWKEGVRKPDRAIFLRLLDHIGASVAECLLIDDQLPNVLAAKELGFSVIHATSVSQTLDDIDHLCGTRPSRVLSSGRALFLDSLNFIRRVMNSYFTALKDYADFYGRAGRAEYWMWVLINSALVGTCEILAFSFHPLWFLWYAVKVYLVAMLVPTLAMTARRMHDMGKPTSLLLLVLVPLAGWIALLALACRPGTPRPNRYGTFPEPAPTRSGRKHPAPAGG